MFKMEFEIIIGSKKEEETIALLRYLLLEHDHTIDDRLNLNTERIQRSRNHIKEYIRDSNNHAYFIAYADEMPVGFLHVKIEERRKRKWGYLSEIFVLKAYRGHQLGKKLVDKHDEWLRNKNIKIGAVTTTAGQKNFQTIKFYRQLGYEEKDQKKGGVILTRKIRS